MTSSNLHIRTVPLAVIFLLVLPGVAFGQSDDGISFEQAYKRGMKHYHDGEYEAAVEHFQKALEKRSHPILLYNLSQSYVHLGDWRNVVEFADRIEVSGEEIEKETATKNLATGRAARVVLTARKRGPVLARAGRGGSSDTRRAPPPTSDGGFGGLGWTGTTASVVGAGLLVGAVAVDAGLARDFEDLNEARAERDAGTYRDARDAIRRKQTTGRILLFTGAGAVAVGTTLLIVELTGDPSSGEDRARIRIAPTPERVDVQFEVNF